MKQRILSLFLALSLLILPVYTADEKDYGAEPNFVLDFSSSGAHAFFTNSNNVNWSLEEGSHTTFTALGNDPNLWVQTLPVSTCDAAYAVIGYRTTEQKQGEFYVNRTDGLTMGQEGTNVVWDWNPTGNWEKLTVHCSAWSSAGADVNFSAFRFDPLHGIVGSGESIDVSLIAFFSTKEEADTFDPVGYLEELKYIEENGTSLPKTEWPDPEYKEKEVTEDDNTPGTLSISYSDDNKYATISYNDGEKDVSYTVKNTPENLFGGYAATDDLGRSLYTSDEVGAVTEDHLVGLFYFLWHGEHGDPGVYDLTKIQNEIGIEAASDLSCGMYGEIWDMHWLAEPLYGYYYANDKWVMRKHAELLSAIGVDFLFFDTTNLQPYSHNAIALMSILHDLNEQGYNAPKVVFYTNTNAQSMVQRIYDQVYEPGYYPDTWLMLDGKPVIIAPYDANINDFFTIRQNQWPNVEEIKDNAWPWMDGRRPQGIFSNLKGEREAINVAVAQHSGTWRFSDSLFGEERLKTNLGRSYHAKKNTIADRKEYTRAIKKDPELYKQGLNFQCQWDTAIEEDVPIVLVTGWNEWIAQLQPNNDGHSVYFVDLVSLEYSRDIEMMKGGYFDNYYIQLAYNIQRLKGTAPIIIQDGRNSVNVTGDFDVWDKVAVTYKDPQRDMLDRRNPGYGNTLYKDESGRNDIVSAKVTNDTENLYFYVQTREHITMYDNNSSWMQLFISTGGEGWYGYDYIVNYSAESEFVTSVAKYSGTEGEYAFEKVGSVSYRAKENQMMIAVPLEMLGITNCNGIKFSFKWADSETSINTMEQFYTEGDAAPIGRLNYVYQNCLDPETAEGNTPVSSDTASTEPSDNTKSNSGIITAAVIIVVIDIAAVAFIIILVRKRKGK